MNPFAKILIILLIGCFILFIISAVILSRTRIVNLDFNRALNKPPLKAIEITPQVYAVISCESQWVETAVGDGGKAYGLAQFHKPTWEWLCKLSGKNLDYYNPQHQIELLSWALENNRSYLWTCVRRLGI